MNVSVDLEGQRYVIAHANGTTCHGFENVLRDAVAMAERMNAHDRNINCPVPTRTHWGTMGMYRNYQRLLGIWRDHPVSKKTWYDPRTNTKASKILEGAIGTGKILRVFYGDPETGRDWGEENDVTGFISRSGGA